MGCGSLWVPGLATSVYAASEGLSVLVLDCRSSGGQAGASARIENYLRFPTGIARAYNQAHKFGVETTIPSEVVGFDTPDANKPGRFVLRLASGDYFDSTASLPSCTRDAYTPNLSAINSRGGGRRIAANIAKLSPFGAMRHC